MINIYYYNLKIDKTQNIIGLYSQNVHNLHYFNIQKN